MANKLSILVLGLLLFVQSLNALPVPDSASSSEEVTSKQLMERFKLFVLTVEEFSKMLHELSSKAPAVFEAVLKDPKITEDKSEEMHKYVKEMKEYVEKSEKVKKEKEDNEAFDMFDEYADIVKKFNSANKKLSPVAQVVEKSLKENGIEEVEQTVKTHFETFVRKFEHEVEDYFKSLNSKEKTEEKEFKEWFDKMKNEKDMAKKVEMFDNFVDDDSNESD